MPDGASVEIIYLHRYEYRTRNEDGTWNGPEIRYSNPTDDEHWARIRHEECHDVEFEWNRKFEGIWGYSWKNCVLIRRETYTATFEEEI